MPVSDSFPEHQHQLTRRRLLGLEQHGGRTIEGVAARVGQRILAMTCAIWHNRTTGQPITRSLIAYDH